MKKRELSKEVEFAEEGHNFSEFAEEISVGTEIETAFIIYAQNPRRYRLHLNAQDKKHLMLYCLH